MHGFQPFCVCFVMLLLPFVIIMISITNTPVWTEPIRLSGCTAGGSAKWLTQPATTALWDIFCPRHAWGHRMAPCMRSPRHAGAMHGAMHEQFLPAFVLEFAWCHASWIFPSFCFAMHEVMHDEPKTKTMFFIFSVLQFEGGLDADRGTRRQRL